MFFLENKTTKDKLFEQFLKLQKEINTSYISYIYAEINWESQMIVVTGSRGIGKLRTS